jgi:hypothetical protein
MSAQRIDRQLEELRLAVAGGGTATDPAYAGIPALVNVPSMNLTGFAPSFTDPKGRIRLVWNLNTHAWDKMARRKDPNAVYKALLVVSSRIDGQAAMRRKAAILAGLMQWMNDVFPMAVGSPDPRLYEGEWQYIDHTPAFSAFRAVIQGIWPW